MFLLLFISLLDADLGNQVSKSRSNQGMRRDSKQLSNQNSKSNTKTLSNGKEKSDTKTILRTLSKLRTINHTTSKSINGNWTIALNPIPYILSELRDFGWNKKSFFLTQADIGSLNYVIDEDEEYGELQNVGKYQATQNRAARKARLTSTQVRKLQKYITLLYYTADIVENTTRLLQNFPSLKIEDFERNVKKATYLAYQQTRIPLVRFNTCNFGGDINSYVCGNGKYTLLLTNNIPNLYINGAPYYTATNAGFTHPSLNITFATSNSDAFSKIAQTQASKSLANVIRDYTNKLEQKGETKIATKIRNKFIETSLNHSSTATANTVIQAINSGSPLAVLHIFR